MKINIFSNQQLCDFLNMDYGIKHARFTRLPIGADMNASVYKAQANNQSYFVKLKHNKHHDLSGLITETLQDAGVQNIIPFIKTKDGKTNLQLGDYTLFVSEFIEGKDGFNCDFTDDQWVTLGKVMRQIHEIKIPLSLRKKLSNENLSPQWRDAVRALFAKIDAISITNDMSFKFTSFLKEHATIINQLIDRAEEIGHQIQSQLPEFVLCHSDIHGGNVLVDEHRKIYIVDWDTPIMAPKERDLMFIGGGVANVWNKLHELELFYRGYGKTKVNNKILAYYRLERIVQDVAEYSKLFLQSNDNNHNLSEAYHHFVTQFEPRGVVEIALKTDKNFT